MFGTLTLQASIFIPTLRMQTRGIVVITLFAATTSIVNVALLSSAIGFPLPFMLTVNSPWAMLCLCGCTAVLYGHHFRRDPALQLQLRDYGLFMMLQAVITLVYPFFAFLFIQVDSVALETFLACLLPVAKLLLKLTMSRSMQRLPELRPAFLMFNVEVFNALFISCCLQNASSLVTTAAIMGLDALHNFLSYREVSKQLGAISAVATRSDGSSEPRGSKDVDDFEEDLVESAVYLLRKQKTASAVSSTIGDARPTALASVARVAPADISSTAVFKHSKLEGGVDRAHTSVIRRSARLDGMDEEQQVTFVRRVVELLYYSEYVILAEYVEVIVSAIYAVYLSVVYELPNRVYYSQLRRLTPAAHAVAVRRVFIYFALELASFLLFERLLRRKIRISPLRQLGLVFTEHGWFLPGTLMLWVCYVVHRASLDHYGVDFTFEFAWLKRVRHHR